MVLGLFAKVILGLFSTLMGLTYWLCREKNLFSQDLIKKLDIKKLEKNRETAKVAILDTRVRALQRTEKTLQHAQEQLQEEITTMKTEYQNMQSELEQKRLADKHWAQDKHKLDTKITKLRQAIKDMEQYQDQIFQENSKLKTHIKEIQALPPAETLIEAPRFDTEAVPIEKTEPKFEMKIVEAMIQRAEQRSYQESQKVKALTKKNAILMAQIEAYEKKLAEAAETSHHNFLQFTKMPQSMDEIEVIKAKIDRARKDLYTMKTEMEKQAA